MMKKRKIALALGLCTVVGLSAIGIAACGNTPKVGSKSEYYLVGTSASDLFGGETDWNNEHHATVAEIPDAVAFKTTATSNVYELTVDLYEGDAFQILIAGKGWSGQMGYDILSSEQTADGITDRPGGGTNSDFVLNKDGKYTLTLTVNGEGANSLTYTRADTQAKLPRLTLDKTSLVVREEADATLSAIKKDLEGTVTWTSDHPEIATVDANGKVTGVALGTATITASCGEKTATCKVTVSNAAVNYYLIGLDNWTPKESLDDVPEKYRFGADTNDVNSYTVTLELFTSNNFKIYPLGGTWDDTLGYAQLDDTTKASFADGGGNNIAVKTSGNYTITVTDIFVPADGETPASTKTEVSIVRKGDATPVDFALNVYAKGTYNGWALDKVNTDALDNDHFTCSKTFTFAANDEFMFMTTLTTDTVQIAYANAKFFNLTIDSAIASKFDLTGDNIKCVEAGSYTVTVKLDKAAGGFESVTISAAA